MDSETELTIRTRIREALARDERRDRVLQALVDEGFDRKETEVLLREAEEERYRARVQYQPEEVRRLGRRTGGGSMILGAALSVIGLTVSLYTYRNPLGLEYSLGAYAATLLGIILFFRGVLRMARGT